MWRVKIMDIPFSHQVTLVNSASFQAAIITHSNNVLIINLEQITDSHITCTEVKSVKTRFYLDSIYCQFKDLIEIFIENLETMLNPDWTSSNFNDITLEIIKNISDIHTQEEAEMQNSRYHVKSEKWPLEGKN